MFGDHRAHRLLNPLGDTFVLVNAQPLQPIVKLYQRFHQVLRVTLVLPVIFEQLDPPHHRESLLKTVEQSMLHQLVPLERSSQHCSSQPQVTYLVGPRHTALLVLGPRHQQTQLMLQLMHQFV